MATSKADKAEPSRVFDVAKPGKSAPDASTRPLIVGHKPIMHDPMVNAGSEDNQNPEAAPAKSPAQAIKVLQPLSEPEPKTTKKDEPVPDDAKATEETAEAPREETSSDGPSAQIEDEDTTTPKSSEAAAVDALASQAVRKKEKAAITEEELQRAQAIQKLIAEKRYHLPIGATHKGRNTALLVMLVTLLLFVGAAALAMDAGLIEEPVDLPFNLIQE